MKTFFKTYWKALTFFAAAGLVGGFLIGLYLMDSYPANIQQQILDQGLNNILLGVITAVQSLVYGVVCGVIGIILAKKVGLWKDETAMEARPLFITLVITVIGGLGIILPDLLFFGRYVPAIMDSYAAKPTAAYILGAIIYGGVIEEVMMRLFVMSLIAFLLHKLFGKKGEAPATGVLVAANVIAALLFAAGHLPTTAILLGLSPMILIRCFLLNGGFGLLFGWLYRKYGLRYSMLAHAGCHVISKLIWILFV